MKQLKITKFPVLDYAGNEAFNTLSTNLSFAGASVKRSWSPAAMLQRARAICP